MEKSKMIGDFLVNLDDSLRSAIKKIGRWTISRTISEWDSLNLDFNTTDPIIEQQYEFTCTKMGFKPTKWNLRCGSENVEIYAFIPPPTYWQVHATGDTCLWFLAGHSDASYAHACGTGCHCKDCSDKPKGKEYLFTGGPLHNEKHSVAEGIWSYMWPTFRKITAGFASSDGFASPDEAPTACRYEKRFVWEDQGQPHEEFFHDCPDTCIYYVEPDYWAQLTELSVAVANLLNTLRPLGYPGGKALTDVFPVLKKSRRLLVENHQ